MRADSSTSAPTFGASDRLREPHVDADHHHCQYSLGIDKAFDDRSSLWSHCWGCVPHLFHEAVRTRLGRHREHGTFGAGRSPSICRGKQLHSTSCLSMATPRVLALYLPYSLGPGGSARAERGIADPTFLLSAHLRTM